MKFAIVGAGAIGAIHAQSILANPRADLAAVCDVDPGAASRLAEPQNAAVVTELDELLALAPDALIVASSTASHGNVALAAIRAGIPFLCEKPLAFDLRTAEEIAEEAAASGVTAAMAFNRRFDAQYSAIKAAVDGGELGRPEVVNIVSRTARPPSPEFIPSSGGLLAEKGSHFYDLARWICSEDPSEVFAMGSVLIDPGYRQVGEVDTAKILLRMPSGTLCQLDFSWRAAYGQDERIEVNGAGGMLRTRQEPTGPVVHQTADGLIHPGKLPGWQERFADTYRAELDAFIDLVDGGDDSGVLAGLPDGAAAQRIAEACKRSLKDNRPVAL